MKPAEWRHEGARVYRALAPHPQPDAPDGSTPKFKDDARHLAAIAAANGGRGFPWLAFADRPSRVRPPWS